jgi:hypothetical protein
MSVVTAAGIGLGKITIAGSFGPANGGWVRVWLAVDQSPLVAILAQVEVDVEIDLLRCR